MRAIVGEGGEEEEVEVVTDLVSFYHLPSSVIGNQRHTHLYAAYLYYYVSDAVPLKQLLEDTLVLAQAAAQSEGVAKPLPGRGCAWLLLRQSLLSPRPCATTKVTLSAPPCPLCVACSVKTTLGVLLALLLPMRTCV